MRRAVAISLAVVLTACGPSATSTATSTPSPAVSSTTPSATLTRPLSAPPAGGPTPTLTGWGELPRMPTARSEVAVAAFANASIYVIGGFGGFRTVERYVVLRREWDRQPDLPIPVDHAMATAVIGGTKQGIFVIGGYSEGGTTSRVFRLGLGAPTWEEMAPMPAPRAAGAAVAIGRMIYVVGGTRQPTVLHNSVYVYDVEANRWSLGADIPTPRDHLAAVALGSVVCAVGGRTISMTQNLAALECYDPATNRWDKRANMPTARGGLGAAAVGNKIVAIGGERTGGTFKEVEIFDAATNTWSRGQDLVHPRHGLGVVATERVIYAIAGATSPGGGTETGIVEYWNLP